MIILDTISSKATYDVNHINNNPNNPNNPDNFNINLASDKPTNPSNPDNPDNSDNPQDFGGNLMRSLVKSNNIQNNNYTNQPPNVFAITSEIEEFLKNGGNLGNEILQIIMRGLQEHSLGRMK